MGIISFYAANTQIILPQVAQTIIIIQYKLQAKHPIYVTFRHRAENKRETTSGEITSLSMFACLDSYLKNNFHRAKTFQALPRPLLRSANPI